MSYSISTYRPRGNYKVNQILVTRNRSIRDDFRQMKTEGIKNREAFFFAGAEIFPF